MTIYYLMVKTHKITGLKYLCQTKQKDPHKYLGSGDRWKRHINKHGKTITTSIICECRSKDELKERGVYYSELWNVVRSNEWANLKPESGDGGLTKESAAKMVETKRRLGLLANTNISNINRITARTLNGTLNTRTPESTQKILASKIVNGTTNTNLIKISCEHCGRTIGKPMFTRWHGDRCAQKN